MLELGNDDLLWPPAWGIPVSHLSWVVVYSVVFAWEGFAFVVVHSMFGCLVHKFALYLSMKTGKTDLSKKRARGGNLKITKNPPPLGTRKNKQTRKVIIRGEGSLPQT
jgi:hypothetical protein